MADIHVDDTTDIDGSYGTGLNPLLREGEKKGSDVDYSSSGDESADTPSAAAGVGSSEAGLNDKPGWVTNRTQGSSGQEKQPLSKKLLGGLKKSGPATAVIGGLVGLGMGASMLLSPSMLLVHIKEVIVGRFNIQSTSLNTLSDRIMTKKLVSVGTSGCGVGQILQKCKYSRMSNKMLTKLKEAGFTPVDKKGVPIEIKDGWGSERPASFKVGDTFKGSGFVSEEGLVEAKNFGKFISENREAAAVFRKVFNPVWSTFWDSTFMTKFLGGKGLSKESKVTGNTEDDIRASFDDQVDGTAKEKLNVDPTTAKDEPQATTDANNAAAGETNNLIDAAGNQTSDELAKTVAKDLGGKTSGGVLLIANLYCMAESSGKIAKVIRGIQMTQIIAYGLLFLQAADEVVAGHGSPAKAAFFGTALTTVLIDANTKQVKKKAATDSVPMKYALLKDSGATSTTSDYTKYLPGGGFVSMLQQFSAAVSGTGDTKKALDAFCEAISSDVGQGAQLLLDFTPAGLISGIAGIAIGQLAAPLLAPLLGMLAGKIVDSSLQAEDLGGAAAIGMVQGVSEGSNAGSMMPLTTDQATAYFKLHNDTMLADARIDQATLSPFDASNPNTFLGSIVTQLIPYYGSMQTATGIFGSITKLVGSSFSSIISPSSSALDSGDTTGCPDKSLSEGGVAVSKLCSLWYAIPVEYLKKVESGQIDPDDNQALLESKGVLNADGTFVTGTDAEKWITACSGGDGSAGAECVIDTEEKARYVIASVNRRLEQDMDGEDVATTTPDQPSTDVPTDPGNTTIPKISGLPDGGVKDTAEGRKQAWAIAEQFVSDVNKAYHKNYKDITNYSLGYYRSAGTLGKSADSFACFGASRCGQCYALSAWFLDKYTKEHIGTTTGSGDGVVAYLKKQGVSTGNEAKVYSVFSYGRAVGGGGAHTGIVVGIDGDYAITVENNYNFGNTLFINKRPKSGASFRGTGDKTVFAYVNGVLRSTPKSY